MPIKIEIDRKDIFFMSLIFFVCFEFILLKIINLNNIVKIATNKPWFISKLFNSRISFYGVNFTSVLLSLLKY